MCVDRQHAGDAEVQPLTSRQGWAMKPFLIRLVRIYFRLGAVFGGLGFLSYVWGLATQANCGFLSLVAMTLVYAIVGALVRTLVWLPSLIQWWLGGAALLQWLLPGLFMTCGTSP
jgi:hypothetical protein